MKREKHFLELNDNYNILYHQLVKEANFWNNSGQYWLGKETYNRALNLMQGDIDNYKKPIRSENLFYNKNIQRIGNNIT